MGEIFGKWLRHHREQRGLSAYRLADLSGMPATLVSSLEKGRRGPSKANLEALASVQELGLELFDLRRIASLDKMDPDVAASFDRDFRGYMETAGRLMERLLEIEDPEALMFAIKGSVQEIKRTLALPPVFGADRSGASDQE